MKHIALSAAIAATLSAGIIVGVDTGKYSKDDMDLTSTQLKAGFNIGYVTPYLYGQKDQLDVLGYTFKDTSYGAGIDGNYRFNEVGVVAGLSYGDGKIEGYDYKDTTIKLGATYDINPNIWLEAGYKRKNMELDGDSDNFSGWYIGINAGF